MFIITNLIISNHSYHIHNNSNALNDPQEQATSVWCVAMVGMHTTSLNGFVTTMSVRLVVVVIASRKWITSLNDDSISITKHRCDITIMGSCGKVLFSMGVLVLINTIYFSRRKVIGKEIPHTSCNDMVPPLFICFPQQNADKKFEISHLCRIKF